MRILISAYACEPGRGSEPGVGWNWARQLARDHEVWVITRVHRRDKIESALAREPHLKAKFVYYDLPRWTTKWWKKGQRGVHLHYHLWQIGAYREARALCRDITFDYVHHVTFGTYWKPSFLALLPLPFIWGPVGGGESAPAAFQEWFPARGRLFEHARNLAQFAGRWDPFVRLTARRSTLALAKTEQTASELRRMKCKNVAVVSEAGLPGAEFDSLMSIPQRRAGPFRILSLGRLVHWKGFELSLRAFARVLHNRRDAEYWLLGDGPDRPRLERLANELNLSSNVKFWGVQPRSEVLQRLGDCDVLVHPSLHDSGGWVCVEAMAAGKPVVCLDTGGPAMQVTSDCGFKIKPLNPLQTIHEMGEVLARLASDPRLCAELGEAGRHHAAKNFAWDAPHSRLQNLFELARPATFRISND
jgi:glycosyltransferase involved in cell wall biosynthesis